ncbi:hypothetical protein CALVIDRAFT_543181 [Calocera viscosa TUFC12733]|uniref:Uncharacterized protein n=2 Tax=Calocera viscosa (strain TUFC12733) TaxID=1330018 RepID=A0A167FW09_CALVF|nr:hypothetical protein CALVIDRAFT_543181 [Calocera viscosa TUFC12733]
MDNDRHVWLNNKRMVSLIPGPPPFPTSHLCYILAPCPDFPGSAAGAVCKCSE